MQITRNMTYAQHPAVSRANWFKVALKGNCVKDYALVFNELVLKLALMFV